MKHNNEKNMRIFLLFQNYFQNIQIFRGKIKGIVRNQILELTSSIVRLKTFQLPKIGSMNEDKFTINLPAKVAIFGENVFLQ